MQKYCPHIFILGVFFLVACHTPSNSLVEKKEKRGGDDSSWSKTINTIDTTVANFDIDTLVKDPKTTNEEKKKIADIINKKYLMGKFNPASDPRFSRIQSTYLLEKDRVMYLRTEALNAFIAMRDAAMKEGIFLRILSATRSFDAQRAIWERKWTGRAKSNGKYIPQHIPKKDKAELILRWSSMPSTSRHHWGTDIDINSVNPKYWMEKIGQQQYKWLVQHASEYGFCQVYTAGRPHGYQEEKWHWSYLPLAKKFTDKYREKIKDQDITGFEGAEAAVSVEMVRKYVLGINEQCL